MNRGYQLIEPVCLAGIFSQPKYFSVAVMFYHWLIPHIVAELTWELRRVEIDIVRVTYMGSYPAIGIHYLDDTERDIGSIVESTINQLINNKSVFDFVNFIAKSDVDWAQVTSLLMDDASSGVIRVVERIEQ